MYPGPLPQSESAPPPTSQPAVCSICRRPQCSVCLGFAMPKLVGFSWLCCPPGTTLLESGPPHWLAMAPGRTVLPSTSLVQVRQTCSPICPAALCQTRPSPFSGVDREAVSTLICQSPPSTSRGRGCWGAAHPPHCHPCGVHAAHHACGPRFLLQQEEVTTSPTHFLPLLALRRRTLRGS